MSTQGTIHSYYLIIDRLRTKPNPTKKALYDILKDQGMKISMRTLDRRIEEIRTEFYLEVPYDAGTNSYSLSVEDQKSLNDLLRFLELNTITRIFGDSIKFSKESIKHFSFDTDGSFQGLSILKPLLNAIQTNHLISFHYHKYNEDSSKDTTNFCPMILREYLGRWYVCGTFFNSSGWFTYGLDRISSLMVSEEVFIPSIDNPASKFDSVIGVSVLNPVEVELAFTPSQAKYIKSLPLHHSQEIISESDEEVVFRLHVAYNYELVQKILMYGIHVRVLKPTALVEDVKNILAEALEKYL